MIETMVKMIKTNKTNKITKICLGCLLISLFISLFVTPCSAYDEITLYREDYLGISNDLYLHHVSIVYNDGRVEYVNFDDSLGKLIDYHEKYKIKFNKYEANKSGVNDIVFNFILDRSFGIGWAKHNYNKFSIFNYKPNDNVKIYCSHSFYPEGADEVWLRFTNYSWDMWAPTYHSGWSGEFYW